MKFSMTGQVTF